MCLECEQHGRRKVVGNIEFLFQVLVGQHKRQRMGVDCSRRKRNRVYGFRLILQIYCMPGTMLKVANTHIRDIVLAPKEVTIRLQGGSR